jgi:hypothetical protein
MPFNTLNHRRAEKFITDRSLQAIEEGIRCTKGLRLMVG